jgi:NhaP-type Na+/H+ or K+/H+ antiporter
LIGNINFSVTGLDVAMIVIVYLFTQIIRIAMIALFYPLLAWIGYGVTINEAIFISWSGVRGAIGITLALVLARSSSQGGIVTFSEEEGE